MIICLILIYYITISPFGLLLRAMRENSERVAFTGIPIYRYRLYGFIMAGAFAGIAGALFAVFSRIAVPEMVHWTQSAEAVLMTVLGGSQFFFGPVVGSAAFIGLKTLITSYTSEWMIYLGLILLIMVLAGFAAHGQGESSGEFLNAAIWAVLIFMLAAMALALIMGILLPIYDLVSGLSNQVNSSF